jgi:hypothetical protein
MGNLNDELLVISARDGAATMKGATHFAGINIGRGHVKVKTDAHYFQYASLVRPSQPALGELGFMQAMTQRVVVDGVAYDVGEEVALIGERSSDKTVFSNWGTGLRGPDGRTGADDWGRAFVHDPDQGHVAELAGRDAGEAARGQRPWLLVHGADLGRRTLTRLKLEQTPRKQLRPTVYLYRGLETQSAERPAGHARRLMASMVATLQKGDAL